MKASELQFDQCRGYLLQKPDGSFTVARSLDLFVNWKMELINSVGDVEVSEVKESKLSPFKIILEKPEENRLPVTGEIFKLIDDVQFEVLKLRTENTKLRQLSKYQNELIDAGWNYISEIDDKVINFLSDRISELRSELGLDK